MNPKLGYNNNDLQEVDHIEELVHDQLECTLSKIELDESEDLQMIYSQEEITDEKAQKMLMSIFCQE